MNRYDYNGIEISERKEELTGREFSLWKRYVVA